MENCTYADDLAIENSDLPQQTVKLQEGRHITTMNHWKMHDTSMYRGFPIVCCIFTPRFLHPSAALLRLVVWCCCLSSWSSSLSLQRPRWGSVQGETIDDMGMEEILHQLATISNYETEQIIQWKHHLPTGAGFLPSTVCDVDKRLLSGYSKGL